MLSQEEGSREGGKRANLDAEEVLFCMVSLYESRNTSAFNDIINALRVKEVF